MMLAARPTAAAVATGIGYSVHKASQIGFITHLKSHSLAHFSSDPDDETLHQG